MKIPAEDVLDYFTDGRRVAFLLERRIASQVLSVARSEGAGYVVLDSTGRKWEVRSVSKSGIYFRPIIWLDQGGNLKRMVFYRN